MEVKEYTEKIMNLRFTDSDLDEMNLFLSNTSDDFENETGTGYNKIAMFRAILKTANAKQSKLKIALETDLKNANQKIETREKVNLQLQEEIVKLQNLLSERTTELERTEADKKQALKELKETLTSKVDAALEFKKTIEKQDTEIENLKTDLDNARTKPGEFRLKFNLFQQKILSYALSGQGSEKYTDAIKKVLLDGKYALLKVEPITGNLSKDSAQFLWNVFILFCLGKYSPNFNEKQLIAASKEYREVEAI